jgi:hypothetical protein
MFPDIMPDIAYTVPPLEDYRLMVERRFVHPNEPKSYAGGRVSSL